MGTSKKQQATRMDWSLNPRGVVSATALTAGSLVALGGFGDLAHIHPVWAGLGTGVGALSNLVVTARHTRHTPGAICYRLACWLGSGGWLTWAWTGPHHWYNLNGLAALAVGASGFAMCAPIGREKRKTPVGGKAAASKAGTELVPAAGPLGAEWEARFKRVCQVKVQVRAVNHWTNGAGYDLVCLLPPGPATRSRIAACCDALATDARLPDGCGCEPKPGNHRGEFILAVSTLNRLGERGDENPPKLHYPADYSPRSILEPVPLGEYRDSSTSGVRLREDSMLVSGRKGSGKTNLLDVLTLGIGRCRDALNWHIDLNGGGMSQFWLRPWLDGEIDRPPIDWAAPTPTEALYMTTLALAIAKDRKTSYREFKAKANAKLLPVSAQLPEIVITIDEGAEALAPTNNDPITRQVRANLEEIQRIGRNEAVNVIVSSLRPIATCISTDLLAQSAIRIGMYGTSFADLGHMYEWARNISVDDLPVKGTAFLSLMPDTPRPMKAYYLEPDQIHDAAIAIARLRSELDAASAEAANAQHSFDLGGLKPVLKSNLYATRYQRMREFFAADNNTEHPDEPTTSPDQATTTPAAATLVPRSATPMQPFNPSGTGRSTTSWPSPEEFLRQHTATTTGNRTASWPSPEEFLRPATPAGDSGVLTASPPTIALHPVPEPLQRALEAFEAASDDRMHSEVLAAELGLSDKWALAKLMRGFGIRSRPKFKRDRLERRGYFLDDIRAAADRIARGQTPAPITNDDEGEDE